MEAIVDVISSLMQWPHILVGFIAHLNLTPWDEPTPGWITLFPAILMGIAAFPLGSRIIKKLMSPVPVMEHFMSILFTLYLAYIAFCAASIMAKQGYTLCACLIVLAAGLILKQAEKGSYRMSDLVS